MRLYSRLARCILAGIIIYVFILVAGCSNSNDLVLPNPGENQEQVKTADIPSFGVPGHQCWGMWDVLIDRIHQTVEVLPVREMSFHLNVLGYLEPPPLVYLSPNFSDLKFDPGNNYLETEVILKHPFTGLDEFTGFDVKGILITDGTTHLYPKGYDNGEVFASYGQPRLENADGLTRWWNPVEFLGQVPFGYKPGGLLGTKGGAGVFSATLNGYKYFCLGLDSDAEMGEFDLADRGHFPAGMTLIRRYKIDFGKNPADFMEFNYAIDASWVLPEGQKPYEVPEAFSMTANSPEPFWIETEVLNNGLYYLGVSHQGGGELELKITVHDWQGVNGVSQVYIDNPLLFTQAVPCAPVGIIDPQTREYYVDTTATSNIMNKDPKDVVIAAVIEDTAYQQDGLVSFYGPPAAKVAAYARITLPCNAIPDVKIEEEVNTLLPTPTPFTMEKDFSVIGNPDKAGVYYFGQDYKMYRYPLDYSSEGELYNKLGGFLDFSPEDLWEYPIKLSRLDMTQQGEFVMFSGSTAAHPYNPYLKRDWAYQFDKDNDPYGKSPVQAISPGINTGVMKVVDISATVNFDDTDVVFWTHVDDDIEPSDPHSDVTVPLLYYRYPYGPDIFNGDIGAISGSPVPKGLGPGKVEPEYLTGFAVSGIPFTAPIGDTDIICAFLEGPPQLEIEVFAINTNDSSDESNQYICTITDFAGTPIDIETFPAVAGGIDDDNDWVVVLEQGGVHETIVEVFSLDGMKKDTSSVYVGNPIHIDVDPYNYKIHIWYFDTEEPGAPVRAQVLGFDLE